MSCISLYSRLGWSSLELMFIIGGKGGCVPSAGLKRFSLEVIVRFSGVVIIRFSIDRFSGVVIVRLSIAGFSGVAI